MSTSVNIMGYTGSTNPEFIKHRMAVFFCIENGLSYPKETSEFFKGKIYGNDLEDYSNEALIDYLKNGIEFPIQITRHGFDFEIDIKTLPEEVEKIVIKWS